MQRQRSISGDPTSPSVGRTDELGDDDDDGGGVEDDEEDEEEEQEANGEPDGKREARQVAL
jgi:hypothetical protein